MCGARKKQSEDRTSEEGCPGGQRTEQRNRQRQQATTAPHKPTVGIEPPLPHLRSAIRVRTPIATSWTEPRYCPGQSLVRSFASPFVRSLAAKVDGYMLHRWRGTPACRQRAAWWGGEGSCFDRENTAREPTTANVPCPGGEGTTVLIQPNSIPGLIFVISLYPAAEKMVEDVWLCQLCGK